MTEGVKTALLTILVYLIALPFVFVAGAGFIAFFIATRMAVGAGIFRTRGERFRPPAEAKAMRKQNAALVFTAGLVIAGVSCRSRSSIWRRRCSAWPSWFTCQAAERAKAGIDRAFAKNERAGWFQHWPRMPRMLRSALACRSFSRPTTERRFRVPNAAVRYERR